jgi:N-methylhydantoinase A/oxoprolinase/acetone carboxylase beta subunit
VATQARPKLFERHIVLPELLYSQVIETTERIGAQGEIVTRRAAAVAKRPSLIQVSRPG